MRCHDVLVHDPRHEHAHFGVLTGERDRHQLGGRASDATVGAFDDVEGKPREPKALPSVDEVRGLDRIEIEVHGAQVVGVQRACVLDGAGGGGVEAVDEHDDRMTPERRRRRGSGRVMLELLGFRFVLAVEACQQRDQDRHQHDDHPRPVGELGDPDDDEHEERQHGADAVDREAIDANVARGG